MLKNSIQKKKTYRDLEIVNLFPRDVGFFCTHCVKLFKACYGDGLFF